MSMNKPLDLALTAEHMIDLAAYLDGIGRSRMAGHARDALTALETMRPVVEAACSLVATVKVGVDFSGGRKLADAVSAYQAATEGPET
ncbi:MAG: hypothetical protein WC326_08455 [Candidatus Delongbacteria bacterium]